MNFEKLTLIRPALKHMHSKINGPVSAALLITCTGKLQAMESARRCNISKI